MTLINHVLVVIKLTLPIVLSVLFPKFLSKCQSLSEETNMNSIYYISVLLS